MSRTKKQLDRERKNYFSLPHSRGCGYPSEPCNCEIENKNLIRTTHKNYCNYPNDPCDCGLE